MIQNEICINTCLVLLKGKLNHLRCPPPVLEKWKKSQISNSKRPMIISEKNKTKAMQIITFRALNSSNTLPFNAFSNYFNRLNPLESITKHWNTGVQ